MVENAELDQALRGLVQKHNADVLFYSGVIDEKGDEAVLQQIRGRAHKKPNIHLFLTTDGGDPDSAYRIGRCLKRHYGKGMFTLVIGWHCKSAGTLLAVGADEVVMDEAAELGPIDTQVRKPDELMESTSGLGTFQALMSLREQAYEDFQSHFLALRIGSGKQISTKLAADLASQLVIGLLAPVYSQFDPMRVGDNARAILIAEKYAVRLANGKIEDSTLKRLIKEYPSHSFVIDREEAKEILPSVRVPSSEEATLLTLLGAWSKHNATRSCAVVFPEVPEKVYPAGPSEGQDPTDGQEVLIPRPGGEAGAARSGAIAGGNTRSDGVPGTPAPLRV